jgi:PTS system mannose-specific IIA component
MTGAASVGIVIVTHGQLAAELLNAAEMIVGDLPHFIAMSIGWHDEVASAREGMLEAAARVESGAGVLLVTDMFGGTPANLALSMLDAGRIEVVTGVNLPMLIKLAKATRGATDLAGLARQACQDGRDAIRMASDLLRSDRDAGGSRPE